MGWWVVAAARAHVPVIYVVGPADDWCATLNGTLGDDVVMFLPGEYRGPCDFVARSAGVPEDETLVTSFDPAYPAEFVGTDGDHVLRVSGDRVAMWLLAFRDLPAGVDAIQVGPIARAWVRSSSFERVDTAVRQVGDAAELLVTQTRVQDATTAVSAGCAGCAAPSVDVATSWFQRVAGGVWLAPGAVGRVTDVVATDGGTAVGGAGDVVVDGVWATGEGPLVDVAGGATRVQRSLLDGAVALRAAEGSALTVSGSTLRGTLAWPAAVPAGWRVDGSAVTEALPAGVAAAGTVVCGPGCFTDAAAGDLYPAPRSPLREAGTADPEAPTDWCGAARGPIPTAGAWELLGPRSPGPLVPGFKDDLACAVASPFPHSGDHTGLPAPHTGEPDPVVDPEPPPVVAAATGRGCGCATPADPAAWVWSAAAAAGWYRTRSRRFT
jgi:hypothetical protein